MTTNQPTPCSSSTLLTGRVLPPAAIVSLLLAAVSITPGVDAIAGDPWSLLRNVVGGPRAMLEDGESAGRRPLGASGDALDVGLTASARGRR
jgi:hypothetical protein